MNERVSALYDKDGLTRFRIQQDENGDEYGEIAFGDDIFPGGGTVDPNSAMNVEAACAHELTHYLRWHNKQDIERGDMDMLDEALTSLEAILHYDRHLDTSGIRQLVADAIQRIYFYVSQHRATHVLKCEPPQAGGDKE